MLINLTELFSRDGKEKDYTLHLDAKAFQTPDGVCDLADVKPVRIRVVNTGDRMLVLSGSAEFALMIPCSRCLEPVKVPFSASKAATSSSLMGGFQTGGHFPQEKENFLSCRASIFAIIWAIRWSYCSG